MTNEQLKQQAIQEAYGEHYIEISPNVNTGIGYVLINAPIHIVTWLKLKCRIIGRDMAGWSIIPKSIEGISDNNGWVSISEDGSNLPVEGAYNVGELNREEFKLYTNPFSAGKLNLWHAKGLITHYRPVVEYPKPVY